MKQCQEDIKNQEGAEDRPQVQLSPLKIFHVDEGLTLNVKITCHLSHNNIDETKDLHQHPTIQ